MRDIAPAPSTVEQFSHLHHVQQAAIAIDRAGIISFLNPAATSVLGWTVVELVGRHISTVISLRDGDTETLDDLLQRHVKSADVLVVSRGDGAPRDFAFSISPQFDRSEQYTGCILISIDHFETSRSSLLMSAASQTADILASSDDFGRAAEQALKLIASTTGAHRVYLYENRRDPVSLDDVLSQAYAWSKDGSHRFTETAQLNSVPADWIGEWMSQLKRGDVVAARTTEAPLTIRSALQGIGIRSLLVVPIQARGVLRGALVLNDCQNERAWSSCEISALSTVARMFAGAIQLAKSERRFRTLVASENQLIWIANEDGLITELSDAWCDLTGMSREACKGNGWIKAIHPRDINRVYPEWKLRLASKRRCRTEYRVRAADGSYKWFNVSAVPVFDELGRFVEWVGASTNIDEEKRAKEALNSRTDELARSEQTALRLAESLREREATYRSIFDHSMDGILLTCPTGSVLAANPAICRMLGYTEEEIITLGRTGLVNEADPVIKAALQERSKTGRFRGELVIYRRDGSCLPIEVSTAIFENANGEPRSSMFVRDITEAVTAREELIAAKEEAEQMAALKSSFLSNMSHEIRTPLTSVIGFSDVLLDGYDGDQNEVLRIIRTAGHRLLETLESVLDLSQIESGALKLSPTSININDIVRDTVEMFERRAMEKGLVVRLELPDEPLIAELDRGVVCRILGNLVSNAVKFADKGVVEIQLSARAGDIILSVSDTGIGISDEFLPDLFEPFTQESSGLARSHEGSGLGLSITRQLVDLLGGTISLETKKGIGSTFTVCLPAIIR
jgi:PAS domain S-box-containing protein